MLGTKPPTESESRLEWWHRQIARQQAAGVSVAEFCRQLGVTVRKFYYWKDRVQRAAPTNSSRGAADQSSRHCNSTSGAGASNFLPVSIVESAVATQLEVELSNACVIRLRGAIDPHLLQAAIVAAGQLDGSRQGADG
jgi:transposase-like protein